MTKQDENFAVAPVSVVCPTYNSAAFIHRMFETVTQQTCLPAEVCICDDGSDDETLSLLEQRIEEYDGPVNFKVIKSAHQGPGAARNQAITLASQPWIAFLDSDDEWEKTKIATVLDFISTYPEANFFCHSEYRVDLSGEVSQSLYYKKYLGAKPLPNQLYIRNLFSTSAVMCKKSLLLERGMFSQTYMTAQDYELWLRLSPYINVVFIPDILGSYIERLGNITTQKLMRRWKNEIKIAWQYRHYANPMMRGYRLLRIMGSYLRQAYQYR